jgi:hypothetical protein
MMLGLSNKAIYNSGMSELNGGTGEGESRRRMDEMRDVIQSLIALTHEQGKVSAQRHEETMAEMAVQRQEWAMQHERTMAELAEMGKQLAETGRQHATFVKILREQHIVFTEEVQDLITLQKEHRIDIMALFEANKGLREAWAEHLKRGPGTQ